MWILLGVGLVLVLIIGVAAVFVVTRDASADEVFLESTTTPGPSPFTASVANSVVKSPTPATAPATSAPTTVATTAPGASPGSVGSASGGEPGLYGGTKNIASCDPEKLIAFLETNSEKARAWAGVLGIKPSEIRTFVSKLTAVVLRNDVRVTNHGFEFGRATTFQAVLQAGTAVLVDSYGRPVVKCYCGNPLTGATPVKQVRYSGPQWSGFSPTTIIVIQPTTVIIDTFVLTEPNGERFQRPPGTDGRDDAPVGASPSTTRAPTTTETPTTSAKPTTTNTPTTPSTKPPTTAPPSGNPAEGPWQLAASYNISVPGAKGNSNWTASITVAADGSVSGSGAGQANGNGGCFNLATKQQVSSYTAVISFTINITGRVTGGTMQLTVSATSVNLDSLVYNPPDPTQNAGCRQEAQAGYRGYVTDQMSAFSVQAASGSSAPVGATIKGTVKLTR